MILPLLQTAQIVVEADRVLNRITPAMYGACIEDVNHEIYGGLYAQRIFGESFEEPASGTSPKGWQVLDGDWTPDGGGIHVRGGNGPKLIREMPDLADGTVEAKVAVTNDLGENAGLLVRVSKAGVGPDDFDGYEISLSGKQRTLILGKHRHDFRSLQTVSAPVVPGHWHRLRVELKGGRILVYLDDEVEPRIDFDDTDTPIRTGKIALRAWRSDASFREIRIDGKDAPISLAGKGVSRMWDRILTGTPKSTFSLEGGAFNGELCQRIENRGGSGTVGVANRGLNRWGISVRKGNAMEGRIYLRGDVDAATVALQSADGSRTYAWQKVSVRRSWAKATFRLKPNVTDPGARFAIWIDQPGSLDIDEAVLLDAPQDRYKGLPIRKDIAETLLDSGVTFLRYGGTMINVPGYRWKSMIGDPDRRSPYAGHWYSCSTNGFGIFDFLNFCERANVGSAFAINVDETPQDAADLADYLTAPVSNPWGRKRAQDGHPAPYHPDYIEIGNEEAIGNPDAEAMTRYAERFRLLAKAIHGRNPKLKLVCGAWWVPDAPQMKTVFEAIDGVAAAWDLHFWCDDPNAGLAIGNDLQKAETLFKSWNPKTTLKTVVFEENGNRHDFQRALGHATTMNATRGKGDFVLVDCAANGLQPWRQNDNGWDQGGVFFTPDRAWTMPPADARRLLARDHLPNRISARVHGDLNVLATRSDDARTVALTIVNTKNEASLAKISLGGFQPRSVRRSSLDWMLDKSVPSKQKIELFDERIDIHKGEVTAFEIPARSIASLRFVKR